MFILTAKGLEKEWNGTTLFKNIDLQISQGEHIALFGKNGSGKTTLIKGLLGQTDFDKGKLQRFVPLEKWGWLEQDPQIEQTITIKEYVQSGQAELFQLKRELESLQKKMENEQSDAIWERYSDVYDRFLQADGFNLELEAEKALNEVELPKSTWNLTFNELSGGQKTKAQLALISMQKPSFIILDEPTNHLDSETLIWLEKWIKAFEGAILYVSHDRYFLDQTADAMIELSEEGSKRYIGGYTAYVEQKEIERRTQETLYKKQEQKKKALLESIDRYQKWFHQAHQAAGTDDFLRSKAKKNVSRFRAKEQALERLEKESVEKPRDDRQLDMRLEGSDFSAKTLVRLNDLAFSYSGEPLFSDVNFAVNRGDRLAVLGRNGSGKSTLLKIMIGRLEPTEGDVIHHPQLKIGYFAQELDNLDGSETILDSLLSLPNMTQTEARTILGCFLFPRDAVFKKVANLSMGEQCRVAFLKLYFSDANLLVLDEPTNYLDVATCEVIEETLLSYPGAMLLVSHDRYFVKKLANRIVAIDNGDIQNYSGSYEEYISHKQKGPMNTEQQTKVNDVAQLELKMAQLLAMDGEGLDDEAQAKLLNEIKSIRGMINQMKS